MNKINKQGKVKSAEVDVSTLTFDDVFSNELSIPEGLKRELKSRGMDVHFINASKYAKSNFHSDGWTPIRDVELISKHFGDFRVGSAPDGTLMRGDLVLAQRPTEVSEKKRAYLRHKSKLMSGIGKQQADDLRNIARSAGVKVRVEEGYDESEQD